MISETMCVDVLGEPTEGFSGIDHKSWRYDKFSSTDVKLNVFIDWFNNKIKCYETIPSIGEFNKTNQFEPINKENLEKVKRLLERF